MFDSGIQVHERKDSAGYAERRSDVAALAAAVLTDRPVTAASVATAPADAATVRGWIAVLARRPGELSDAARVDLIRALEDLKSAASAGQARLSADLDVSQRAAQRAAGVPADRLGAGVASQVALARRESAHAGGRYLGLAKALVGEMPHTLAALSGGVLSEWRATLLVRESACLTREDRAAFDREVAGDPRALTGLGDRALVARAKQVASTSPRSSRGRGGRPPSVASRCARPRTP